MQIKLNDVVSNVENLQALQEIKFPVKVSYRIKRLIDKLDPILKAYNEKRNDLVKEFGEEQEDKSVRVTDPAKLISFSEKLSDLLTSEETVDFEKIKVEELGDVEVSAKLLVSFIFE